MCISNDEGRSFEKSPQVYHVRKDGEEYNLKCLAASRQPVVEIHARNAGRNTATVDVDDAGRLENSFLPTYESEIMLIYTMAVAEGHVNGSRGRIESYIWHDGVMDLAHTMPALILVHFPEYLGYKTVLVHGILCVTICVRIQQFEVNGMACQWNQLPLVLSDAVTIHKSQALSLEKVVLTISKSISVPVNLMSPSLS